MPQEIERKFLVTSDSWRTDATGKPYCQGYIATTAPGQSVRVRIAGDTAYLTIKGPTQGLSRAEFEYEIPLSDAKEMLETLCDRPFIEKIRYRLPIGSVVWRYGSLPKDSQTKTTSNTPQSKASQSKTP